MSSVRGPTERISALVDLLLKPLVKNLPSYVRDTKDFLTALQAVPPWPDHALLFSMDVVGFYNNIPHVDGLEVCRASLNGRRVQYPQTEDIVKLAELVLNLNAFQFEDKYFFQKKGTAMGTRMAPSYANLFMGKLENKILEQAPDGNARLSTVVSLTMCLEFGSTERTPYSSSSSMQTTATWKSDSRMHLESLSCTLTRPSRSEASTSPRTCSLNQQTRTSTCCPPATTPPHVHRNLPYGLALRIQSIVSDPDVRDGRFVELTTFLRSRGYQTTLIRKQLDAVRTIPRQEVLQTRRQDFNANRVP